MHNGPAILLIFLLCYVVQSLCTHIALKLPNAKGVDSFMDHVLQMLIVVGCGGAPWVLVGSRWSGVVVHHGCWWGPGGRV